MSPEGAWVAYAVTETRLADDKSETRVWMVPRAGGEAVPLTRTGSSASRPRWSPDGKYLAFLAARDTAKTQVWVLDRRGGEAWAITDVKQGVSSYDWSPDGSRLLLAILDPEEADSAAKKSKTPKPWVIDRLQFKRDGEGYLTGSRRTHYYLFDVASKRTTQITSGDTDDSQGTWSPDGRRVAFVSNRTDNPDGNENTDIWVVAADNADSGRTMVRITDNPGPDESPAWAPDGKTIAYVGNTKPDLMWYAVNGLWVAPAAGGAPRSLTPDLDRNVSSSRFSSDGRSVFVRIEDSGEDHLARVDVATGRVTRVVAGAVSVGAFDVARDGTPVALVNRLDRPAEVHVIEGAGSRALTGVNDSLFGQIRLGEVRAVRFPSADGTEVEAFVYLPAGYEQGRRYPTLLRLHGGPVAQYGHSFNFEAHLFAANGYVVITPNPRGSSGYGEAFSRAIFADWGTKDFQDVMAGVDYAVAQGWSDPDRLGVGGWSYGGILTNYVLTQTDRFKGAVSGASEVLYVANYGHDHYQLQWELELGLPWTNRAAWERISPFNNVEKIVTPTLVMGGEHDWNVPILNSEQLYQSLRRLGRTTQLVVYPDQPHGLRVPSYQKDRLERYLGWYGKYVKGQ
jgi:dipeptidyl aminopeptidase/acylaminoacyl peptidase